MSNYITNSIGANIKMFREERNMSQLQLAEAVNVQRPSLSNWENGKSDPSAQQLLGLSKALDVSVDSLLGNTRSPKQAVIVDTSILMKRPMIIDELVTIFDEVIVPYIVTSELNNIKDNKYNASISKKAAFVLNQIESLKKAEKIIYKTESKKEGIPDEKIFSVAIERARGVLGDKVYMFSNDIYFSFLVSGANLPNLENLTFKTYADKFSKESECDLLRSQKFYSLVNNKNLTDVKNFDMTDVNVNLIDAATGLTPLIQAIRNRDIKMVEYICNLPNINLDKPDKQRYYFTPLLHSVQMHRLDILKILVEKGADPEVGGSGKNIGNMPLMVSAWHGWKQGVEYLLEQDVCVNQQDTNGYTALIKACINKYYEIALLLVRDTDVNIRSRENKRAEDYITQMNLPYAEELVKAINKKKET
ncbi:MAG: ankyrin repeat domain-containing protein [Oscillospiraceae bacterium]|jgi:transcriptional regulator with XRE-family HTH domain|nr:ankyrin repeat domain-containing protein [Oscillospiraceae bacterium]